MRPNGCALTLQLPLPAGVEETVFPAAKMRIYLFFYLYGRINLKKQLEK